MCPRQVLRREVRFALSLARSKRRPNTACNQAQRYPVSGTAIRAVLAVLIEAPLLRTNILRSPTRRRIASR